ncbi:MAG: hypothetical protein D6692_01095 [Planctomycetota bacterium]|nr:MAG: hypothetical protein D6692_01095 [Planctomycetota bacterium]
MAGSLSTMVSLEVQGSFLVAEQAAMPGRMAAAASSSVARRWIVVPMPSLRTGDRPCSSDVW